MLLDWFLELLAAVEIVSLVVSVILLIKFMDSEEQKRPQRGMHLSRLLWSVSEWTGRSLNVSGVGGGGVDVVDDVDAISDIVLAKSATDDDRNWPKPNREVRAVAIQLRR